MLNSFRKLLLNKSRDNNLSTLISVIKNNILNNLVLESLEKMAKPSANSIVQHFAENMNPKLIPDMVHDALGHHISRYKTAVKSGRDKLANQHADKIFKIIHLAHKAEPLSEGKLHIEAEPIQPWSEHTYNSNIDNRGWDHKGNDYSFLKKEPKYGARYDTTIDKRGIKDSPYPLENIKVNGKYVHVDDINPSEIQGFESHPFDNHPVLQHYNKPKKVVDDNLGMQYVNADTDFQNSKHVNDFDEKRDKLETANPEAYANRGSKPSDPVHDSMIPKNSENVPELSDDVKKLLFGDK